MVSGKEMTASSNNIFYLYLSFFKSSLLLIFIASVREAWNKYPNAYFENKKNWDDDLHRASPMSQGLSWASQSCAIAIQKHCFWVVMGDTQIYSPHATTPMLFLIL